MVDMKQLTLTDKDAQEFLKKCAKEQHLVFLSRHARERMAQRNITRKQIMICLEKGRVTESPYRDVKGDWRCAMEHYTSGIVVNVAVAIKLDENGNHAVIVTVF